MSVLVFAENLKGECKKGAFEALTYGKMMADKLGTTMSAVTIGKINNLDELASYGAEKIYQINAGDEVAFDSKQFAKAIADQAVAIGASIFVAAHTSQGKALAGRLSVRMDAGLVTGVNGLPQDGDDFVVRRSLFSGKALADYAVKSDKKVITVIGNTVPPVKSGASSEVVSSEIALGEASMIVLETRTVDGEVPLPEAEVVVSAGRGMKGPENWGIIEELASTMGATTACSRPVADADWRPHHEHVGQTGVAIRPNLYIAIGISGAIQHLAGVNNSKVIVVINKDPEAPFFKAADYGIVGDLFEVVPKLNEAFKEMMAS